MERSTGSVDSRPATEAAPAAPRRWSAWRIAVTVGLCALLFIAAYMADEWIPPPIWSLLNGLFWVAGLVSAVGFLFQIFRRRASARPSLPPSRPQQ